MPPKTATDYQYLHDKRVIQYGKQIDKIFDTYSKEFARLGVDIKGIDLNKPFSFADYPETKVRVEKLLNKLHNDIQKTVLNGVEAEWSHANKNADILTKNYLGSTINVLPPDLYSKFFNNRADALAAFTQRRIQGITFSNRIWKTLEGFQDNIETVIDRGIRAGQGADEIGRAARQFLKEPDRIYRNQRVYLYDKDGKALLDDNGKKIFRVEKRRYVVENGKSKWVKETDPYRPGQGVYSSSTKNAKRMASFETNKAYITAGNKRADMLDFQIGWSIRLSNNHTLKNPKTGKPEPFYDMCDELWDDYPKEFDFSSKWHLQCRDIIAPLNMPIAEFIEQMKAGDGINPTNKIEKLPPRFWAWYDKTPNADKYYVIIDNQHLIAKGR